MKKKGFTLAEVLITLGIVGVVAALVIPGLVNDHQNKTNAARLAVAVNNFETALTTMISKEGAGDLYGTSAFRVAQGGQAYNDASQASNNALQINGTSSAAIQDSFIGNLAQYMSLTRVTDSINTYYGGNGPYVMDTNGKKGGITSTYGIDRAPMLAESKNGVLYAMRAFGFGDGNTITPQAAAARGTSLCSDAIDLAIDVNGKEGPNIHGRDIFDFYVGSDGILYPFGSDDTSLYDHGDRSATWRSSGYANCQLGSIGSGHGCTARVVAEGFKINY